MQNRLNTNQDLNGDSDDLCSDCLNIDSDEVRRADIEKKVAALMDAAFEPLYEHYRRPRELVAKMEEDVRVLEALMEARSLAKSGSPFH